jgi:Putative prokaryotic signal transducing protein
MQTRPVKSRTSQGPTDALRIVDSMKELLRTNNAVRLSWLQALLRDSGIESLVLDHHTSLVEGSIGAIPRRLMVAERDFARARTLLAAADEDAR